MRLIMMMGNRERSWLEPELGSYSLYSINQSGFIYPKSNTTHFNRQSGFPTFHLAQFPPRQKQSPAPVTWPASSPRRL